jgi:hypothetical protein
MYVRTTIYFGSAGTRDSPTIVYTAIRNPILYPFTPGSRREDAGLSNRILSFRLHRLQSIHLGPIERSIDRRP